MKHQTFLKDEYHSDEDILELGILCGWICHHRNAVIFNKYNQSNDIPSRHNFYYSHYFMTSLNCRGCSPWDATSLLSAYQWPSKTQSAWELVWYDTKDHYTYRKLLYFLVRKLRFYRWHLSQDSGSMHLHSTCWQTTRSWHPIFGQLAKNCQQHPTLSSTK